MKKNLHFLILLFNILSFAQQRKVNGIIKDSIGEVIPGASIIIEGTNRGTYTDFEGKYSINVTTNEFLIFSYIGKKEQRISANKNEINVQLMDDDIKLIEGSHYIPNINPKRNEKISFERNDTNIKKIRGFVFDNSYYTNIPLPYTGATIEVKGTNKKTISDIDGKFEIEAKIGDELIVSGIFTKIKIISVTDKNCYKINLDTTILDCVMIPLGRKAGRQFRKYERKLKDKIERCFYDCSD